MAKGTSRRKSAGDTKPIAAGEGKLQEEGESILRQLFDWVLGRPTDQEVDPAYQALLIAGTPLAIKREVSLDDTAKGFARRIEEILGCNLVGMKIREFRLKIKSRMGGALKSLKITAEQAAVRILAICFYVKQCAFKRPQGIEENTPKWRDAIQITMLPA